MKLTYCGARGPVGLEGNLDDIVAVSFRLPNADGFVFVCAVSRETNGHRMLQTMYKKTGVVVAVGGWKTDLISQKQPHQNSALSPSIWQRTVSYTHL